MSSPDPTARRAAALAGQVPGYDGYLDPKRRRDTERALRVALSARVRACQSALRTAGSELRTRGRFDEMPAIEMVHTRLDRLVDRLIAGTAGYADWLGDKRLPDTARGALVALDHGLWTRVADVEAEARALETAGGDVAAVVARLAALADGLHAAFDARAAALVAPAPPLPASPRTPMDGFMVGDGLRVIGEAYTVAARVEWDRGDLALWLADMAGGSRGVQGAAGGLASGAAGGLRLWEDTGGALVLFEAQPIEVALPPPDEVPVEGEHFRLAWADEGRALVRAAAGGGRQDAPRWLFTGDGGGWLWVESSPGGARVWLGLAVDASELIVI